MTATPLFRRLLPAMACILLAGASQAQTAQQPLTGQMLGGSTPAATPAAPQQYQTLPSVDLAPAPPMADAHDAAAAPARPVLPQTRPQIGDTTRGLFQLQASGQQRGGHLPILGDQATASYARYLKSFQHDIPEFFETDVGRSTGSSSSGR